MVSVATGRATARNGLMLSTAIAAPPRLADYTDALARHSKSISFARYLSALHACEWPTDTNSRVVTEFRHRFGRDLNLDLVVKAAVGPGVTSDPVWGGPLAQVKPLTDAFLTYAYGATVLGKLATRPVPFNCSLPVQTSPGVFSWAGEAKPKPFTKLDFATATVHISKALGHVLLTDDLLRLTTPGTETALRDTLAAGVAAFVDRQLLDPAVTGIANVRPAAITNGVTPITPSGTTSAALAADVGALIGQFFTNNPNAAAAALIMSPSIASMLVGATKVTTLNIVDGGSYAGVPVVVSGNVGASVVAVDASAILVASGGIVFGASSQTAVEMVDTPTDPATATTILQSLWQLDLTALRSEWFISWAKARATAVSLISPVAYVPGT